MKQTGKKTLMDMSVMTVKVILCILLVFNTFMFLYYGTIDRLALEQSEPFRLIEDWSVTDNEGNEIDPSDYAAKWKESEKDFTLCTCLPDRISDNEFLFFDTRKDAAVYINGELRKDFVEERDVAIPGGTVKRFFMLAPLKASDSGAQIRIVLKSKLKGEQIVPETFISTRYGAFSYLMKRGGLSFFLASIILMFSIVVIIISVVMSFWYKLKIDMMYGALGIFILASWLVTDSPLFPFVFGMNYVSGILNYMFCLMIPLAPAVYLNSVLRGRYKKSVPFAMLLSGLNAVVWPLLHFLGVRPFYHVRDAVNLILVFMAVYAIALLILDAVKGNVGEYRYTFTGFMGFLVCAIVELAILLIKPSDTSVPMVAGLGFLLTFIVIQQVDDLRKVNAERQHAIDISEAKTRFLASMSHEIRTPINAILGMNEMILRENTDEVVNEYARSVKTSGKMLLMLVNDVLDFSKIEAGKLEISEARFCMSEMLYDVISLVSERADEKSLELKTEITDEIPDEVISDEFRIRQILVNLINNAIKYTQIGTVTLKLGGGYTEDGYELAMVVKDTGKGIRKEDQEQLFEAFSRADVKENANIEGTGLGLAIVKSIVDSMHGTLGVESEYGTGSEFWVKLPVKYAGRKLLGNDFMNRTVRQEHVQDCCGFMAPEAKILAVDDNQSNLTIVKLFLKRTGIVPDLCSTGTRAIELCREQKYDLILLDHMMPKPDGIETLHTIRKDKASLNRDTKVIVLTANAVAGSRQMYLQEGFEDYLTKPLDAKLLEQTVKDNLPADKVIDLSENGEEDSFEIEFEFPAYPAETGATIRSRLTAIEGLDYETALSHCGGDEAFLEEIVQDVASDCDERVERMRRSLAAGETDGYEIEAHTIKSTMATIGMKYLSERAKKHEFAAKSGDMDFIEGDAEDFINTYITVCKKMEG